MRARPAASLVLVWRDAGHLPHVFMGRRNDKMRFLPGHLVFPGGRVERQDSVGDDLQADKSLIALDTEAKMPHTAQGFMRAAVRECFEETGLDVSGHLTTPLHYGARAITPPHLPMRYDTRFFFALVGTEQAAPLPSVAGDGELITPSWIAMHDLQAHKVHHVTRKVLDFAFEKLTSVSFATDLLAHDDQLLVADVTPKGWRGRKALRSRDLKAAQPPG